MKRSLICKLVMIVMFFAVQDTFSMDNVREVMLVLNKEGGNLLESNISVMIYSYNPNVGYVDMNGTDLDADQGSTSSRITNLYKGPLIEKPILQKKSKLQRMSRRFAQSEVQQVFKEGYIQKIEIEDSRGVIYSVNQKVIDVINRKLEANPGKILKLRVMRLPSGSYAISPEF